MGITREKDAQMPFYRTARGQTPAHSRLVTQLVKPDQEYTRQRDTASSSKSGTK